MAETVITQIKKWREPMSLLSILFIASHRGVDVEVFVIANWQTKASADKKCVNTMFYFTTPQLS
ncbi:MAG: hypothetical protein IKB39_03840 [Bacteroidaceae bacterium]|nr:hypothetical protein [Bacteroidaceae bacterium]